MLFSLVKPEFFDNIGRLQMIDGDVVWNVYVTTGAIEKLARAQADDTILSTTSEALERIARRKLRLGQALSNSVWIRSLDIPE